LSIIAQHDVSDRYMKFRLIMPITEHALLTLSMICSLNFRLVSTIGPKSLFVSTFSSLSLSILYWLLKDLVQPYAITLHVDIFNDKSELFIHLCKSCCRSILSDCFAIYLNNLASSANKNNSELELIIEARSLMKSKNISIVQH